ncbi:hypothetical protein OEZ85_012895 [Tetradesmus obliquus]|uniref:O-methyltransferase domain-containing protein n=1 Tax=Tetradesmus obliquus TaxID=3088 RepID=A0ABY8U402_TETOB|nr:hypothetical protein OEZ85_012895 [Tetradesmus obliquus]
MASPVSNGADQTAAAAVDSKVTAPSEAELVLDMCTAHWKQQALRAAVKLGVMDAPGMADSAVPINQLAAHTSSNEDHLYRLLRYLSQFGIFEELPSKTLKLTSMGQHLRADHPSGLCYAAASFGAAGHFIPWMHLDKAVKEGKPAFEFFQPNLPGGAFQYMSLPENKEEEHTFNKLMTMFTKTMDVGIVNLHDFSGYRVVADIGGGYGRLLMDIMDAHPGVQEGIVFEMPSVVDMVPEAPERFKGKINWVKGDFFTSIAAKADCYVMKSILHDWSDERCVTILTNLRASMAPGSVLVNFDRLMPCFGTPGFHPAKGMDINMMTMVGGKERTTQQWHDLLGKAGFAITSISQGPSMAAILAVPSPPN